jgi:hypothetical protein
MSRALAVRADIRPERRGNGEPIGVSWFEGFLEELTENRFQLVKVSCDPALCFNTLLISVAN